MNGWKITGLVVILLSLILVALFIWQVAMVYGQVGHDTSEPKNLTNYLEMYWTSDAPMNENLWVLDELVCELVWAQTNTAWTVTTTTTSLPTTTLP